MAQVLCWMPTSNKEHLVQDILVRHEHPGAQTQARVRHNAASGSCSSTTPTTAVTMRAANILTDIITIQQNTATISNEVCVVRRRAV